MQTNVETTNVLTDALNKIQGAPAAHRQKDVTYHKVKMTPAMAQAILASQEPDANRRLDVFQVTRLVDLIRSGKWEEDVDSVKLTKAGRLVDGQHRLHAVIQTGKTLTMLVAYGIPESVIKFVDTGKRRTTGQTLQILGSRIPAIRLAAANLLAHFERLATLQADNAVRITARFPALDPDSVIEVLKRYDAELTSMASVLNEYNAAAVYAPLVYAAHRYPEAAKKAMEFIKDGQVGSNEVLQRFHAAQKRLARRDLGGGTDRAEAMLFVLDLVRAIETGKAPRQQVRVESDATEHIEVLRFFLPPTRLN